MARKEPPIIGLLLGRLWLFVSTCGLAACVALGWHLYSDPSLLRENPVGVRISLMLCVLFGTPTCLYGIMSALRAGERERRLRQAARELAGLRTQLTDQERSRLRQRARMDELATLREVAYIVNREGEFSLIAEKVLELLAGLLEPLQACIFVIDEPNNLLKPFALYADGKVKTGARLRASGLRAFSLDEFKHRSVICSVRDGEFQATVPLKADDETLGGLLVVFPRDDRSEAELLAEFNERWRDFLLELSRHISLAVKTKHLQAQVLLDGLTHLYTKTHFADRLEGHADLARRHKEPFALILLDIDHFKRVNDTFGHAAGDEVLKGVATTVRRSLRKYDSGYRTGGEELAVLLPRTNLTRAAKIAERLRNRVQSGTFVAADGARVKVTASFGVAQYRSDEPPEDIFERCDKNLYAAKRTGRNRVVAAIKRSSKAKEQDA
ncbi:MAG: GGDEF domain-containing protein [Candidatus Brocadiia bacterium]|jgi:diguanylate cyclase (GGDEF)-like protein|nr:GGDEF domain-containing protein [Candidatus Brocadiia bacterium]